MTHFADYTPQNLGTDFLEAACGRTIHVDEFSLHPTCKSCQTAAGAQRALLMREKLARLRLERQR